MKDERKKNIFIIIGYIPVFILFSYLLLSCAKNDNMDEPSNVKKVLLVYLAGDNNLSGESYEKIEAIRKGWDFTSESRILIYHDALDTAPRLMEITADNSINIIEQYEIENSADPVIFGQVISRSKALYPQADFNLLVFSHASGWLPDNSLTAPRSGPQIKSILVDGEQSMELVDFAAAIPDKTFSHIIFETCFMAGIEVAYQLKDKTDYILCSSAEIVSPGFTDIYIQSINDLVYGDPRIFIKEVFNHFNSQSSYMRSATLSVIRTNALDALSSYIMEECNLKKQLDINNIQRFNRNSYHLFFDFRDYHFSLLETDSQKQELSQLIENCVEWKASTPYFMEGYNGYSIEEHSGLTAYIVQEHYPYLNKRYTTLDWYKAVQME